MKWDGLKNYGCEFRQVFSCTGTPILQQSHKKLSTLPGTVLLYRACIGSGTHRQHSTFHIPVSPEVPFVTKQWLTK